jgi:uncharacterized OB-fold protein
MALLKKIDRLEDAVAWHGEIPISSRYTAGIAGERFFREIKEHARFVGTRCDVCDLVYVPATMFCERCFAELDEWVDVSRRGSVFTFTVLHRDLDQEPLEPPAVLAYVKLDGSDGGLVHYLGEIDPDEVCIGMEVEAKFRQKKDRRGSVLDVEYFRPLVASAD